MKFIKLKVLIFSIFVSLTQRQANAGKINDIKLIKEEELKSLVSKVIEEQLAHLSNGKEEKLNVAPLLQPIGDLCQQNEMIVKSAIPALPKVEKISEKKSPCSQLKVPEVVIVSPQHPPPVSPLIQSPNYGIPNAPLQPIETVASPPYYPASNSLPTTKCSSCSEKVTPCSSCVSKAKKEQSAPVIPSKRIEVPGGSPIPADPVSIQLANRMRDNEKVKIEGEIAYGFKTLPVELDHIRPQKERFAEESLFDMNGKILEFTPEQIVLSKSWDPYRRKEMFVASKVSTETKTLSLPELGFGPVFVEPLPYFKKDARHDHYIDDVDKLHGIFDEPNKATQKSSCKDSSVPGEIVFLKQEEQNGKHSCSKCQ